MNCLFTVIIPTYNSENYIYKAIESVLCQKLKNLELLIIDNISTDNTLNIINSFKDYRIKIYSERDSGIYDAMNKGITLALGEWIYFLGSNDYLINEYVLNNIENIVTTKKVDLIYGNVIWGHNNTIHRGKVYLKDLYFLNICHQALFIKKGVILRHGSFNVKYNIFADWELNLKLFNDKSVQIEYVDQVIAYYDITGTSALQHDEFINHKNALIKNYLSYKNQFLLFLSKVAKKTGNYLIPKK